MEKCVSPENVLKVLQSILEKSRKIKAEIPLLIKLKELPGGYTIENFTIIYYSKNFHDKICIPEDLFKGEILPKYKEGLIFAHTHPSENGVISEKYSNGVYSFAVSLPDRNLSKKFNIETAVIYMRNGNTLIDIIGKDGEISRKTLK